MEHNPPEVAAAHDDSLSVIAGSLHIAVTAAASCLSLPEPEAYHELHLDVPKASSNAMCEHGRLQVQMGVRQGIVDGEPGRAGSSTTGQPHLDHGGTT